MTTVFHQSLLDLEDDRIAAVRLDGLISLHGRISQIQAEEQAKHSKG